MSEWQPIETAPRDETPVLLFIPDVGMVVGDFAVAAFAPAGEWFECYNSEGLAPNKPTHWMPLPEPPPR